jgi:hypothetical protein
MENYKKCLSSADPRINDELFSIKISEDTDFLEELISSPARGEFELFILPHGFYLLGFEGEDQLTIINTSNNSSEISITAIYSSLNNDHQITSTTTHFKKEVEVVNNLLNKLYFSKDPEECCPQCGNRNRLCRC